MPRPTQEALRQRLKGKDYRDYLEEFYGKRFSDSTFNRRNKLRPDYDQYYEHELLRTKKRSP